MKNKTLLAIILIFILSVSCKKGEKELERDYIDIIIKKVNISNSTKWMIILPGLGCHGCIREGEVFMRDNINNKNILFVLTKIESLKILQKKIEINVKKYSNIYIDNKEGFNIPTKNSGYPCIAYIENGELISHEFQSPGNNAFDTLRKQLRLEK